MTPGRKKVIILVAIAVAAAMIFFIASGGNRLSGTWYGTWNNIDSYPNTVQFSGNRFTAVNYLVDTGEVWPWGTPVYWGHQGRLFEGYECYSIREFVGSNGQRMLSTTTKGRYSITDGRIEIICSCGYIWVHDFRRTDNTIEIDGNQRLARR
jgi:hypothetical protein